MNRKNLIEVFDSYINNFDMINNAENNENYKWGSVKRFNDNFNLNVNDYEFAEMLKKAWYATDNLIDNQHNHSFYALYEYSKHEPSKVRDILKNLLYHDSNDLDLKTKNIQTFLAEVNLLHAKYCSTKQTYVNDWRSALAYLWFYNPDSNYFYKATASKTLAKFLEFDSDFGTYSKVKLHLYYRFCDELIEEILNYPALLETHKTRFKNNETVMHEDKNLHILLYDIFYCADKFRWCSINVPNHSGEKNKKLYLQKNQNAQKYFDDFKKAEENYQRLEYALKIFPEIFLTSSAVTYSGKPAKLLSIDNGICCIYIEESAQEKKLDFWTVLMSGLLKVTDSDIDGQIKDYRDVILNRRNIPDMLEYAKAKFKPYEGFFNN